MHGEQKHGRTKNALQHLEQKFNHQHEIRLLQNDLKMAQDERKTAMGEKQVLLALKAKAEQSLIDARAELEQKKLIDTHHSNMHKVLRIRAEKERDMIKKEKEELKAQKRKLEFIIADMLDQKEGTRAKMRKIIAIASEE
jgi:hypothetical protein